MASLGEHYRMHLEFYLILSWHSSGETEKKNRKFHSEESSTKLEPACLSITDPKFASLTSGSRGQPMWSSGYYRWLQISTGEWRGGVISSHTHTDNFDKLPRDFLECCWDGTVSRYPGRCFSPHSLSSKFKTWLPKDSVTAINVKLQYIYIYSMLINKRRSILFVLILLMNCEIISFLFYIFFWGANE